MTPEAQRIAIARGCGIKPSAAKRLEDGRTILIYLSDGKWLPDYCNCLNAMAQAEQQLTREQELAYRNELQDMHPYSVHAPTMAIRATAAQRAEAFLKTLGLWKEGK